MAMTWERFDTLVARLEQDAQARPRSYKLRVALLAVLGYVYIVAMLALIIGLAVGIFALLIDRWSYGAGKFAWVLLVFAFVIARSLWVRLPPPDGRPLRRADAPALFAMIDEVRAALRGPRVHQVLLTDDFNAAVVQLPRLGVLGWQKNYVIVGLPLMHALSPDQFRAVLAHEFGHLGGAHGRFGAWIYRVRQTWAQLLGRLEQRRQFGSFLFRIFFNWYAPFFYAYSSVLARAQEYEADRSAAKVVGARTAADALLAAEVSGAFLDEQFWPDTFKAAMHEATPPAAPFSALGRALRRPVPPGQAQQWLQRALNALPNSDDSHPSLTARLNALEQAPRVVEPPAATAAAALLGEHLDALERELNGEWREAVAEPWRDRYNAAQDDRRRLDALRQQAETGTLPHEEALEHASLTEEWIGAAAAEPLWEAILATDPTCAPTLFRLGCIRLDNGDERGIALLERAMEQDDNAVIPACEAIYGYLITHNQAERAQAYRKRALQRAELLEDAEAERADVSWFDTLLSHEVPAEQIQHIVEHVAQVPDIARAYLVRKQVALLPDEPLYVLGLEIAVERRRPPTGEQQDAVVERLSELDIAWPGPINVYVVNTRAMLHDKLKRVPGALIFDRSTSAASR